MQTRLLPTLLVVASALAAAPVDVRSILRQRVFEQKKNNGIVAGVIDGSGHRDVFAVGNDVTAESVLEIGSITKVFTSLLLADMIERGELTPDTPVVNLLPKGWSVPAGRNGRQITVLHLSQQVSGLPRLPHNLRPADAANPYADYTPDRLKEFLAGHTLRREPGEQYEYSNLGVGLLGYALAQKAGMGYEELLKKRVLLPLGMTSTGISLTPRMKERLAPGHAADLRVVSGWDLPDTFAGAGALRSTVDDMLRFLSAASGRTDSPLQKAFARLRSVSLPTGQPNLSIEMGWHVLKRPDDTEIVWHNGGTGGYSSFAGFVPSTRAIAVVLADTSQSIDDIARHILDPSLPLRQFVARTEVTLPETVLDKYVGTYQMAPGVSLTVSRKGTRVFAQATGQGEGEIFAERRGEFFAKIVDAQFVFVEDAAGRVTHCILRQNGRDTRMARLP